MNRYRVQSEEMASVETEEYHVDRSDFTFTPIIHISRLFLAQRGTFLHPSIRVKTEIRKRVEKACLVYNNHLHKRENNSTQSNEECKRMQAACVIMVHIDRFILTYFSHCFSFHFSLTVPIAFWIWLVIRNVHVFSSHDRDGNPERAITAPLLKPVISGVAFITGTVYEIFGSWLSKLREKKFLFDWFGLSLESHSELHSDAMSHECVRGPSRTWVRFSLSQVIVTIHKVNLGLCRGMVENWPE